MLQNIQESGEDQDLGERLEMHLSNDMKSKNSLNVTNERQSQRLNAQSDTIKN
jgi:hypothetical protein